jgi:hypothetical protein
MAKVISTLFSILLLVLADRLAVHFKMTGLLPTVASAESGFAGSNETRIVTGPEHYASTSGGSRSN